MWPEPWWRTAKVWIAVGTVAVLVAAGLAWALAGGSSGPSTFTLRGAFSLDISHSIGLSTTTGPACAGGGPVYSTVHEGVPVEVVDPSGRTVVMGRLGLGRPDSTTAPTLCRFPFVITKVPAGLKSYSFHFGVMGVGPYPRAALKNGVVLSVDN